MHVCIDVSLTSIISPFLLSSFLQDDRQSADTGRGSMEPASDRETEEQVKDVAASNKDKKKKSMYAERFRT